MTRSLRCWKPTSEPQWLPCWEVQYGYMSSFNMTLSGLLAGLPTAPPKPKCLYIGPMKGEDSPTRERFNAVYEEIVVPAAKTVGMEPDSALSDGPGMITPGIFRLIRHAQVIVADITGENTCVGYELAFAHSPCCCTVLVITGSGKDTVRSA